jgi:hypothetical protein
MIRDAARAVTSGKTAIDKSHASEIFLEGQMPKFKNRQKSPQVPGAASLNEQACLALKEMQKLVGRPSPRRMDTRVLFSHTLEERHNLILP